MNYPIYRKYPNNLSYFKIVDADHFIEIKRTGKRLEKHLFEAKILPDRNFIQDMISMQGDHWVVCSPEEFEQLHESL